MTTQYSPVYGIAYCDDQTLLKDVATVSQQAATTIEAALLARGIPPTDLQALIAAGWFTDTGYKPIAAPAAGFAVNGSPSVRRLGKSVTAMSGYSNTGMAINSSYTVVAAGGIPADCRPSAAGGNIYSACGTSAGQQTGVAIIGTDGSISIRTGAVLSAYYRLDGITWLTA